MNAIVIVFIPKEERAMAIAKRLRAQSETSVPKLLPDQQAPPLWTWFIENPRRHKA